MKFIRRPDLDKVTRAEITAQAFLAQGIYGEITRLARCYRVSRLFVYTLLWQFQDWYAPPCPALPPSPRWPVAGKASDRRRIVKNTECGSGCTRRHRRPMTKRRGWPQRTRFRANRQSWQP
jgi:hypothetical protein